MRTWNIGAFEVKVVKVKINLYVAFNLNSVMRVAIILACNRNRFVFIKLV